MQLQILPQTFAVCQIQDTSQINWQMPLFFFSKTAEELSLVCPETDLPAAVLQCERGWRALKICGVLDFALVGILAKISVCWQMPVSVFLPFQPIILTISLSKNPICRRLLLH